MHMRRRVKQGFSMIELIIGIAVIGVLTAVVLNQSQKMRESSNLSRESSNLSLLTTAIQSTFSSQGSYRGLTNEIIKSTNAFPAAMDGTGTNIDSVWNSGDITVAPEDYSSGSETAFSITYNDVPQTSCVDFVSNNYSTYYKVTVGSTIIYDREPGETRVDYSIADVMGACGSSGGSVGSGSVGVEFRSR